MDIETGVRNDNSSVAEYVHSTNSVTSERMGNSFLHSIGEEINLFRRLTLSRIPRTFSISGELAKSTSPFKLLTLLTRNSFHTISDGRMGVLGMRYPSYNQYLPIPGTQEGGRCWANSRGVAQE